MTWAAFVKTAYKAARSWGIQPSEFWGMTTAEWWAEFDTKLAESREIEKLTGPKIRFTADEIERVKAAARKRL